VADPLTIKKSAWQEIEHRKPELRDLALRIHGIPSSDGRRRRRVRGLPMR